MHCIYDLNWISRLRLFTYITIQCLPASVAKLDARPTGNQEVAGSTPAEAGNILSWRLIMKYFIRSFSPFRWFKKGSCQFSRSRWLSWMRRPTGDQEVAGSTPPRSATFFRGDWSWNIFYGYSLPSADSRRAVVSFWRKNVHNTG